MEAPGVAPSCGEIPQFLLAIVAWPASPPPAAHLKCAPWTAQHPRPPAIWAMEGGRGQGDTEPGKTTWLPGTNPQILTRPLTSSENVTNPKPRERFVSLSIMMIALWTGPRARASKYARRDSAVTDGAKPPTNTLHESGDSPPASSATSRELDTRTVSGGPPSPLGEELPEAPPLPRRPLGIALRAHTPAISGTFAPPGNSARAYLGPVAVASRGTASLTSTWRPSMRWGSAITLATTAACLNVTNPNPRGWRERRLHISTTAKATQSSQRAGGGYGGGHERGVPRCHTNTHTHRPSARQSPRSANASSPPWCPRTGHQ